MKIRAFTLIFLLLVNFGCEKVSIETSSKSYSAGFMYWYHPTVLQERWEIAIVGEVIGVETAKIEQLNSELNLTKVAGKLKVHEKIFAKDNITFDYDSVYSTAGFTGLAKGDKVLMFLTHYENGYNFGEFEGTQTMLGIKLDSFSDPIVDAYKRRISTEKISTKDYALWERYDTKGLKRYKEMQALLGVEL
jgi:hypothetical protein